MSAEGAAEEQHNAGNAMTAAPASLAPPTRYVRRFLDDLDAPEER